MKKHSDNWRNIASAPDHKEILLYREDAGVLLGIFTCLDNLLYDREKDDFLENSSEDELFELAYFAFLPNGGIERLEGAELPTHWMPLPEAPESSFIPDMALPYAIVWVEYKIPTKLKRSTSFHDYFKGFEDRYESSLFNQMRSAWYKTTKRVKLNERTALGVMLEVCHACEECYRPEILKFQKGQIKTIEIHTDCEDCNVESVFEEYL